MLKSKEGERLYRKVEMKIVFPKDTLPLKVIRQHAGPKQGFNPDGIAEMQMKIADELDTLYPWWEFGMTALAPEGRTARYNFVVVGYRAIPNITPKEEVALEPEMTAVNIQKDNLNPTIPSSQE